MQKRVKLLGSVLSVAVLTGCASSGEYYQAVAQANAEQAKIEQIRAESENKRIEALVQLASSGSEADRASATIALALSGRSAGESSESSVAVPRKSRSEALEWASVLLPFTGQLTSAYFGYTLGKVQSDNNAKISLSRDEAYTELGISQFRERDSPRYTPVEAYDIGDNRTEVELERIQAELE